MCCERRFSSGFRTSYLYMLLRCFVRTLSVYSVSPSSWCGEIRLCSGGVGSELIFFFNQYCRRNAPLSCFFPCFFVLMVSMSNWFKHLRTPFADEASAGMNVVIMHGVYLRCLLPVVNHAVYVRLCVLRLVPYADTRCL